jgi:hypothetical protein
MTEKIAVKIAARFYRKLHPSAYPENCLDFMMVLGMD